MNGRVLSGVSTPSYALAVGFFAVVLMLLALPYYLTQVSEENSTQLNIEYFVEQSEQEIEFASADQFADTVWNKADQLNFGLDKQPHWLTFNVPTTTNEEQSLMLIKNAHLDDIKVWFVDKNDPRAGFLEHYSVGDTQAFKNRPILADNFVLPIPDSSKNIQVFMRVYSRGSLNIPIEIWGNSQYIEFASLQNLLIGVFFGYMIAMTICNLFAYASSREPLFLTYTAYVVCITMVIASLFGLGFHYFWSDTLWFHEISVPLFANLTPVFVLSLSIKLLNLESDTLFYKVISGVRILFITMALLCFVLPFGLMLKATLALLTVVSPLLFLGSVYLGIKGNNVARYFVSAWMVLLFSTIAISAEGFGWFKFPIDGTYMVMVGAIAEALLVSYAITVNFNQRLDAATESKQQALQNEEEALRAKDELYAEQEKNKQELEFSIEERTLELEIALRELADKNKELEKLSAIDPLTGLMNRRYFDKRILAESRRSKREQTSLGLAILDIDHFKKINDTYGHLAGDHCLKVFAKVLRETVKRPSDTICRYGGEEFILILPNTPISGLYNILERVREAVEQTDIVFEGHSLNMTVSIGASTRVIASESEHELLVAFVDKQLYQAKENGRNRLEVDNY